ncbi:MAG: hypothetical protein KF732_00750 [Flavobacteriales bacterium]|nr:hypothetical protein [Flavobacteriales bacterium]MBV6484894.1 hypothetical protein [Flavobacteriales bacterium]MBX2958462.1 hypothetical protein [Flavobacteriales bacterium]HRN40634.1 hypothetical protein [Vicingus sp.]
MLNAYYRFLGTPRLSSSSSLSSPPTTPTDDDFDFSEKLVLDSENEFEEAIGVGSSPLEQDERK